MQLSVLAGDFLLSRACVALAALGNTEVHSYYSSIQTIDCCAYSVCSSKDAKIKVAMLYAGRLIDVCSFDSFFHLSGSLDLYLS